MDRGGRSGPDRKGTSRMSKPATSRMNVQGGGTSRAERAQGGGVPPAPDNKNTLYIAIGGGALVLVIVMALMLGGGEEGGSRGGGVESMMKSAINRSEEAFMRAEYRQALDIAEDALKDPRAGKSSRYKTLQACAAKARLQVNLERDGQVKVAEFKNRIDAAVKDQTAMAKASGFMQECLQLEGQFGGTSARKQLKDIKEDLRRWVATEGQGDWQRDYNTTKARIEKSYIGEGLFSEAIREWRKFGEVASQDPLLRSRIDSEIGSINLKAVSAAEKVVTDAGGDRSKLEEAQQRFNGTDGLAVINKAMKGIK
jgi:hypothetical protein